MKGCIADGIKTYRVGATKFLLCADIGTLSPSCVERRFATDDFFLLNVGAGSAGFAADLRDGVPVCVGHICRGWVDGWEMGGCDCWDVEFGGRWNTC